MTIFAYKKSAYARDRIERLRNMARRGGIASQKKQALRRMENPIGPRSLPPGEWLRCETRSDRYGNFVRIDVFKSLRRANQRDVIVDSTKGLFLVEGISEGELARRRFSKTKHLAEIEED